MHEIAVEVEHRSNFEAEGTGKQLREGSGQELHRFCPTFQKDFGKK